LPITLLLSFILTLFSNAVCDGKGKLVGAVPPLCILLMIGTFNKWAQLVVLLFR